MIKSQANTGQEEVFTLEVSNVDIDKCEKVLATCLKRAFNFLKGPLNAVELKTLEKVHSFIQADIRQRIEIIYTAQAYSNLLDPTVAHRVNGYVPQLMHDLFNNKYDSLEIFNETLKNADLCPGRKNIRIEKKFHFLREKMQSYLSQKITTKDIRHIHDPFYPDLKKCLTSALAIQICEHTPQITVCSSGVFEMFFSDYCPAAMQEEKTNEEKKGSLHEEGAISQPPLPTILPISHKLLTTCTDLMKALLDQAIEKYEDKLNPAIKIFKENIHLNIEIKSKLFSHAIKYKSSVLRHIQKNALDQAMYNLLHIKYPEEIQEIPKLLDKYCLLEKHDAVAKEIYILLKETLHEFFTHRFKIRDDLEKFPAMADILTLYQTELQEAHVNELSSNYFGLYFSEYSPALQVKLPENYALLHQSAQACEQKYNKHVDNIESQIFKSLQNMHLGPEPALALPEQSTLILELTPEYVKNVKFAEEFLNTHLQKTMLTGDIHPGKYNGGSLIIKAIQTNIKIKSKALNSALSYALHLNCPPAAIYIHNILYNLLNNKYKSLGDLEKKLSSSDSLYFFAQINSHKKIFNEDMQKYFTKAFHLRRTLDQVNPAPIKRILKAYKQQIINSDFYITPDLSIFLGLYFSEYFPELSLGISQIEGFDDKSMESNSFESTPIQPKKQLKTNDPKENIDEIRKNQLQAREALEKQSQKRAGFFKAYENDCANPAKKLKNIITALLHEFELLHEKSTQIKFPKRFQAEKSIQSTQQNVIVLNIDQLQQYIIRCNKIIELNICPVVQNNDFLLAEQMIADTRLQFDILKTAYQEYENQQLIKHLKGQLSALDQKCEDCKSLIRNEIAHKAKILQLQEEEKSLKSILSQITKSQSDYNDLILQVEKDLQEINVFLLSENNQDIFKEYRDLFKKYAEDIAEATLKFKKHSIILQGNHCETNLLSARMMLHTLEEKNINLSNLQRQAHATKINFVKNIIKQINNKISITKDVTQKHTDETNAFTAKINSLNIPLHCDQGKQLEALKERIKKECNDLIKIFIDANKKSKDRKCLLTDLLADTNSALEDYAKKSIDFTKNIEIAHLEVTKLNLAYQFLVNESQEKIHKNLLLAESDPDKKNIIEISCLLNKYSHELKELLGIKEEKGSEADYKRQVASLCIKQAIVRLAQLYKNQKYHSPNISEIMELRDALVHYSGDFTPEYFHFLVIVGERLYENIQDNLQNIENYTNKELDLPAFAFFLRAPNEFTNDIFNTRLEQFINIHIYYTSTVFKSENEKMEVEQAFSSAFAELIDQAKKLPGFFDQGYQAWLLNLLRNFIRHPEKISDSIIPEDRVQSIMTFFISLLSKIDQAEVEIENEKIAPPKGLLFSYPAGGTQLPPTSAVEGSPVSAAAVAQIPVTTFQLKPSAKVFVPGNFSH